MIARSSQPEVGWLGWRSKEDEDLLKALSDACSFDEGESIVDSPINYPEAGEETAPANKPTTKVRVATLFNKSIFDFFINEDIFSCRKFSSWMQGLTRQRWRIGHEAEAASVRSIISTVIFSS